MIKCIVKVTPPKSVPIAKVSGRPHHETEKE